VAEDPDVKLELERTDSTPPRPYGQRLSARGICPGVPAAFCPRLLAAVSARAFLPACAAAPVASTMGAPPRRQTGAPVIQKKTVLLGAPGVGKTSLVRRFVQSLFDDTYLTTIGVKVDKKALQVAGQDVTLMLWDVAGTEEHFSVPPSYVRGAAGYLLVVDGTRPETLDAALDLVHRLRRELDAMAGVLVLNKADLVDEWKVDEASVAAAGWSGPVLRASAKSGSAVERAFTTLAEAMLA
jgi:small GTP-binding protein